MTAVDEDSALGLGRTGALATAVFARRSRRNAISQAMLGALAPWYPRLARDPGVYAVLLRSAIDGVFSVGGDVRELVALTEQGLDGARDALGRELQLLWRIECFSKPIVSLIDGVVMGSGVGLTLYGTHRVAGAGYRFAMPETAIGYFPDCGVAHAFARMPAGIGAYLGLTGAEVGPGDALRLGLVTHVIEASAFGAIEAALADADPVDPVLDTRHRDPGPGAISAEATRIGRYFEAESAREIVDRLTRAEAADRDWAEAQLATLRARSPFALAVTHRAIRAARHFDIREALRQDFRMGWRMVGAADFREGVRAQVIDKDRRPRWPHGSLDEVSPALVEATFAPLGEAELALPSRAEMQAARG